jgi:hypothetical protein
MVRKEDIPKFKCARDLNKYALTRLRRRKELGAKGLGGSVEANKLENELIILEDYYPAYVKQLCSFSEIARTFYEGDSQKMMKDFVMKNFSPLREDNGGLVAEI